MRYFAANFIFDGYKLIKNAYVGINTSNEIVYVSSENEALKEKERMIFYNGIICPSFVNAHCHLELSGLLNSNYNTIGLSNFIERVMLDRNKDLLAIKNADKLMYENGISLVADTCNTCISAEIKSQSSIEYKNFVEISGIKDNQFNSRLNNAIEVQNNFTQKSLNAELTLHSFYSISNELLKYIVQSKQDSLSIHFFESKQEIDWFYAKTGDLANLLLEIDNNYNPLFTNSNELNSIINNLSSSKLILVHNTELDKEFESNKDNIYYCICPNSNIYLHNTLPKQSFINRVKDKIVIGTDSFATNDKLCILTELKTLSDNYKELSIEELLRAATSNGAEALGCADKFGSLNLNTKPGLILLENLDLINKHITNKTTIKRLL